MPIGLATAGWVLGKVMEEKRRLKFVKEWEGGEDMKTGNADNI